MKKSKIVASAVVVFVLLSFTFNSVFAENKYIKVDWWNQPDPEAGDIYWSEAADGSFEQIDMTSTGMTTIAYVPAGYAAGPTAEGMPRNFDLTVDLMVPDTENYPDAWSGFYLRASQPQTGAGGYLFHINSTGLGILDGESQSNIIEERVNAELIKPDDWNRVRVVLDEKNMTVWINGTQVFTYSNCMTGPGYLGLTTVNYLGKFRNYMLIADGDKEYPNFVVEGTEGPISVAEPSSESESSVAEVSTDESSDSQASSEGSLSQTSESVSESSSSSVTPEGSNNTVTIVLIILAVVAAGALAGFLMAKKKKQ